MQLIRISRRKQRTYWQKFIELILALKIEIQYSKKEIFALYAANAPFGGNVVGLEAASWRYYGRSPHLLSWAEAATLAVLPNAPSLIYPGKNQTRLLKKRNFLLHKLYSKNKINFFVKKVLNRIFPNVYDYNNYLNIKTSKISFFKKK